MIKFLKVLILLMFIAICDTCLPAGRVRYAFCKPPVSDKQRLTILTKQVIEAKNNRDKLYAPFAELSDIYCKNHQYNDCVEFLSSLASKNKAAEPFTEYYIASCRYSQLKYLEETQGWDEYFADGNSYRDQITSGLEKAIAKTNPAEPLNIYARLLKWRFHKDQQDTFQEAALTDLMNSTREYAKETVDPAPIKKVADELFGYGEKFKAKEVYKIYVDRIISFQSDENKLKDIARSFYQEGNLEFAEVVYDAYIEKIAKAGPQEKSVPELIEIAKLFSPQDKGLSDPVYAEKVFKKIEEIGGKDAFSEELIYLRSFALEKAKEYAGARDNYIYLLQRYPATAHADEANFKIAIISAYILKDLKTAQGYLGNLANKEAVSPQVISSLYQLGLLNQWQGNYSQAQGHYNRLLEKAKAGGFPETLASAKERLKEISESKPIEYNLKIFIDASLKDEYAALDMGKMDLKSSVYRAKKEEAININSGGYSPQAGCLQVEQQYLWSGDTGKNRGSFDQPGFDTSYSEPGTKVISLTVASPSGIVGRNIYIIDVE